MADQTPVRRTQAERTKSRKEQLIREAMRYFSQYGYRGARLADIAKAAGVTEPGLLHHFPSKAHLLMEVLAERDRFDQNWIGQDLDGLPRLMVDSLRKLIEHNQEVPGLVQLFTILVAESIEEGHPGHEFFTGRYRQLRSTQTEMIRQAQEKGEVRADIEAKDLAVMFAALMDGLQVQWLYEPDQIDMARIFQQFARILRNEQL